MTVAHVGRSIGTVQVLVSLLIVQILLGSPAHLNHRPGTKGITLRDNQWAFYRALETSSNLFWLAGLRIRIHFIRIRNRIRIQHFRLNTDPDPDPGLNDQKLKKKNYSWKKMYFFGSKTTIYLSLSLHKERPSYRRSPQISKEAIQHFKTRTFKFFLLLWVIFALLDPDPDSESGSGSGSLNRLNPDPIRIRIRNPGFEKENICNQSSPKLYRYMFTL